MVVAQLRAHNRHKEEYIHECMCVIVPRIDAWSVLTHWLWSVLDACVKSENSVFTYCPASVPCAYLTTGCNVLVYFTIFQDDISAVRMILIGAQRKIFSVICLRKLARLARLGSLAEPDLPFCWSLCIFQAPAWMYTVRRESVSEKLQ